MRFFSRKKQPAQIGFELSEQLKKSIATIPDTLSSLVEGQNLFDFRDIDKKRLFKELVILITVGQRLAIQKNNERTKDEREAILKVFDWYLSQNLDNSPEFLDLSDKRGEQYSQSFNSHIDEINNGDWTKFFDALGFKFDQFCRGVGNGYKDNVFIVGSCMSSLPLRFLANHYWLEGFTKTLKYLMENK
jgi:hypothetical protein